MAKREEGGEKNSGNHRSCTIFQFGAVEVGRRFKASGEMVRRAHHPGGWSFGREEKGADQEGERRTVVSARRKSTNTSRLRKHFDLSELAHQMCTSLKGEEYY